MKKFNLAAQTDWIKVKGAREHNLKDISVAIPKGTLTVITGPSGSGKSSLALDILYTEGKRRYTESLSAYARQFLGIARKPDVDSIEGLCPSIAIEQKTVGSNPRSTVGTITEIYDYLRVLFARVGIAHCPNCHAAIHAESPQEIVASISNRFANDMIQIFAPLAQEKKGEFVQELIKLFEAGYYRIRIDGIVHKFASLDQVKALNLKKSFKHTIDVLIDMVEITHEERSRVQAAIETAFSLTKGMAKIVVGDKEYLYSSDRMCVTCGESVPELEPRNFSFNSPIGACPDCQGLGVVHTWPWAKDDKESWKEQHQFFADIYAQQHTCKLCLGKRLNKYALAVTIGGESIANLSELSIKQLLTFFKQLQLDVVAQEIAQSLVKEIVSRLTFLYDVGLSYLTINRSAQTLSGGEGQRIRLATQIGSMLSGVLYVLDEPSIGLHQRDNERLIEMLEKLRDLGNTVVVVEHDMDTIARADYVIDMGPAAGVHGGRVVAVGTPAQLKKNPESLSGAYLAGTRAIKIPARARTPIGFMTLHHARKNNLHDLTVRFPLGVLCGVSGVSGSGKSTLIMQELVPSLQREFAGGYKRVRRAKVADSDLEGADSLESLVVIDQTPIGRTPRSNPATYLGVFDDIRKLYAALPESNARGYKVGRFSFNAPEGRCFECRGDGTVTIEMHFLPEVTMECKACKGKRYNSATLEIVYRGKNIADILAMTAYEALAFFEHHKTIARRLQLVCDVGLDYIQLGQPSTTLSGGEAQRIKLVDELAKRGRNTLYILDEPTTGLHNSDIERLLKVLNTLVDKGNSMIVIEHNIDVLKTVDYLIDMGPEGGDEGGYVVAQGTPRAVSKVAASYTGHYLKPFFR